MEQNVIHLIEKHITEIASRLTQLHFEKHPELLERYGEIGKNHCYKDAIYNLEFLVEALKMDHPGMYGNYILWAAAMLENRSISSSDLTDNLLNLRQVFAQKFDSEVSEDTDPFIDFALEKLAEKTTLNESHITEDNPYKNEANQYLQFLLEGERIQAKNLIDELVKNGADVKDIYQHIFQPSQYEVGRLWQCNKITVAHEHYCTAATQLIMSGLYSYIFSADRIGKTLVACSISGELHELGIRMVTDFFEMDGWDTYYLGASMPDRQLIEALIEHNADVLAISVTLPTHVSKAAVLIKELKKHPSLTNLKILVGGYPFLNNPGLWEKIKADGCAENAEKAIELAKKLTGY